MYFSLGSPRILLYSRLPQDTDTRGNCRHVRLRYAPFSITEKRGWRWVAGGLFVERIFSAHPLAGITARINSQQKYARYFSRPNENIRTRAHGSRKKGTSADAFVRRCASRILLSDRASQIFTAMNRRGRQKTRVLFAPRHRSSANHVNAFTRQEMQRAIAINHFRFRVTCIVSTRKSVQFEDERSISTLFLIIRTMAVVWFMLTMLMSIIYLCLTFDNKDNMIFKRCEREFDQGLCIIVKI